MNNEYTVPPTEIVHIAKGRHGTDKKYHLEQDCPTLEQAETRGVERRVLPSDMALCQRCDPTVNHSPDGAGSKARDRLADLDPDDVPALRSDGGTRRHREFNADEPPEEPGVQQARRAREHADAINRIIDSDDHHHAIEAAYHDVQYALNAIATVHEAYARGDIDDEQVTRELADRRGGISQ